MTDLNFVWGMKVELPGQTPKTLALRFALQGQVVAESVSAAFPMWTADVEIRMKFPHTSPFSWNRLHSNDGQIGLKLPPLQWQSIVIIVSSRNVVMYRGIKLESPGRISFFFS